MSHRYKNRKSNVRRKSKMKTKMKDLVGWLKSKLTIARPNVRDTISSFLVFLVKKLNANKYEIRSGKLLKIKVTNPTKNLIVLSPDGIGKLASESRLKPVYDIRNNKVSVMIDSKDYRIFSTGSLFTLEVVDDESYIGYPLHPYFYKYVAHAVGEKIHYHVSAKGNALLTKKDVEKLQLIGVIGSTKGGLKVLNSLKRRKLLDFLNM